MQLVLGQRVRVKNDILTMGLDESQEAFDGISTVLEAKAGESGTIIGIQDMPWGRTYTVRFDVHGCSDVDPSEMELLS